MQLKALLVDTPKDGDASAVWVSKQLCKDGASGKVKSPPLSNKTFKAINPNLDPCALRARPETLNPKP